MLLCGRYMIYAWAMAETMSSREHSTPEYEYFDNGQKRIERHLESGQLHRDDGPAQTEWFENGQLKKEEWYKRGKLHRDGLPAVIEYQEDRSQYHIYRKQYHQNGELHFENGPADIVFTKEGYIRWAVWYHRSRMGRFEPEPDWDNIDSEDK